MGSGEAMKAIENANYCTDCAPKLLWGAEKNLALQYPAVPAKSKCHGYLIYQIPITCCTSDSEFGPEEKADQLINGYYCFKCNKIRCRRVYYQAV